MGGCGSNFSHNNTSLRGLHLPVVIQSVKTAAGLSLCQGGHFYLKGSKAFKNLFPLKLDFSGISPVAEKLEDQRDKPNQVGQ